MRLSIGCLLLALAGCTASPERRAYQLNAEGVELLARRDFAGAQDRFQAALALQPADSMTHYNLANAAHQNGNLELAERSYQASLKLQPDYGPCRHGLALLLLQQNRGDEARNLVESWLAEKPMLADAQAEYGWWLRQGGDLPAAQVRLQKALEIDPHNVRALTELGIIYEAYAYPDRAKSLYQRVLRKEPNQPEVIARLTALKRSSK
jgi:Tfp pilus assembly protein PilF